MGHRVWGFAGDDFHDHEDFRNAFLMVGAQVRTKAGVLDALRRGRFYASTGLTAREVRGQAANLSVRTASVCRGRFIGAGGQVLSETRDTDFSFEGTHEPYLRFEADGEQGTLFTQPVFRKT